MYKLYEFNDVKSVQIQGLFNTLRYYSGPTNTPIRVRFDAPQDGTVLLRPGEAAHVNGWSQVSINRDVTLADCCAQADGGVPCTVCGDGDATGQECIDNGYPEECAVFSDAECASYCDDAGITTPSARAFSDSPLYSKKYVFLASTCDIKSDVVSSSSSSSAEPVVSNEPFIYSNGTKIGNFTNGSSQLFINIPENPNRKSLVISNSYDNDGVKKPASIALFIYEKSSATVVFYKVMDENEVYSLPTSLGGRVQMLNTGDTPATGQLIYVSEYF